MENEKPHTLFIDSSRDSRVLKVLGIEIRLRILELLQNQELNVTEIAQRLDIPQSTAATGILALEEAGLVDSHIANGIKGGQKICTARYKEIFITFTPPGFPVQNNVVEIEMPAGLFTSHNVCAPCGLCSREGVIGYLDVPGTFYSPERVKAALVWFENGYVEYKFPNNSMYLEKGRVKRLELSLEMSSEAPGTNTNWPSDISVWINEIEIGVWTSPGDFGDRRGRFTPSFWKLEGSQYGILSVWEVAKEGTFIDRQQRSQVTLDDLGLDKHHSVKVRIGIADNAKNTGGVNIFGKGFGDYDQDIILKLYYE